MKASAAFASRVPTKKLGIVGKAYLAAVSGKGDVRGKAAAVAFITAALIALVALLAGALQAAVLIQKYAATDPLPGPLAARAGGAVLPVVAPAAAGSAQRTVG